MKPYGLCILGLALCACQPAPVDDYDPRAVAQIAQMTGASPADELARMKIEAQAQHWSAAQESWQRCRFVRMTARQASSCDWMRPK